MTTTYTKSLATDFGGDINENQFHAEIEADSGITTTLIGITHTLDVIEIIFESALSGGEETILDGLIAAHVPNTAPPKNTFYSALVLNDQGSSNSTYTKYGQFEYNGSNNIGTINYIEVIGHKDTSPTSYAVRIYDKTNNTVIAEKTDIVNTEDAIIDLGAISNVPIDSAIFEIQCKRIGGFGLAKKFYVDRVIVYYNN